MVNLMINLIPGIGKNNNHQLIELFKAEQNIAEVILYGSRAKGTYKPGSDIDLTIKGDKLTTTWLLELSVKIDNLLMPYEVDLSIFKHIDNPDLVEHINRVGMVVFKHE
jgi:predicted nucleotidyltransferase